jgi:hypothetical protein
MMKRILFLLLGAVIFCLLNRQSTLGQGSILSYPVPFSGKTSARLLTDMFYPHDFSTTDGYLLTRWFSGGDPALADDFATIFRIPEYMTPNNRAMNLDTEDFNCDFHCYWKPFEYNQQRFLDWLAAKRGMNDYLPAKARRFNDYKGDLSNPIVSPGNIPKPDDLKKSYGKQVRFGDGKVFFLQDNRLNPTRWWAPYNLLMHHETTATFMVNPVSGENIVRARQIMDDYLTGKERNKRLVLCYKAKIRVEDYRKQTGEHSIFDMYLPGELESGKDLLTSLHREWRERAQGDTQMARWTKAYMERRLENPFVQVSICVNMAEANNRYILQEFMLFNKDYLSTTTGQGKLVNNSQMNEWMYEGGCGGFVGWNRFPVDKLKIDGLTCTEEFPVVINGGKYVDVSGNNAQLIEHEVEGAIDITNYYVMARKNDFFPSERFSIGDEMHGFSVPEAPEYEPDFKPSIYWTGFMFEMTGPYKLEIEIEEFNVVIER